MYRLFLIIILTFSCFVQASQTSNISEEEITSLSIPEQIAGSDEDFLIGNILNPLSGNICLSKTDLIAKGAQSIYLTRYYNPPFMPEKFDDDQDWNEIKLYQYIRKEYKGWRVLPHLFLNIISQNNQYKIIRVTFSNGLVLDYKVLKDGKTILSSDTYGMSNIQRDIPNGKNDLRNIKIFIEDNEKTIIVQTSDGTKKNYNKQNGDYYLLSKELLPNSKILRYNYDINKLISIESLDPSEKHIYATLQLDEYPNEVNQKFISSSNLECVYTNEQKVLNKKITEKKKILGIKTKDKYSYTYTLPNILNSVSSPFYRNETITYNNKFLLDKYLGKNQVFSCEYKVFGNQNPHFKIHKLNLPVGNNDSFIPAYEITYDIAKPGEKGGKTIVKKIDGSSVVYEFSKSLLMDRISYFDKTNILRKEKIYTWHDNNWLKSLELKDSNNRVYVKSFKYDALGNPIEEAYTGNLEGDDKEETYIIKRKFSDDSFNNLLYEENDDGLILIYSYLPNTNLILSKFTKDKNENKILIREFYEYDSFNNLIKKIIDDGTSINKNDLSNVLERKITKYCLRQNLPFLHMIEAEEDYYLDGSNEKLIRKLHYTYDNLGNIKQEDVYDADNTFAYSIFRKYNERGDLLSETNPIKQKANYEFNQRGFLIKSQNFSNRITTNNIYDTKGRLKESKEVTKDSNRVKTFEYDSLDNLISKKDHFDNITYYTEYDPVVQKPNQIIYPKILTSDGTTKEVALRYNYNALGKKLLYTDANKNIFEYKYNANMDPIEITYPNGSKEIFKYFKNGKLKSSTNRDGLETRYKYDVLGRTILKQYYFENKKITDEKFEYNSFHLKEETDVNEKVIKYEYDFAGRKLLENVEGRISEYNYDALGRVDSIIKLNAENTLIIKYKRDLLDRIIKETKTDLNGKELYKIEYGYDPDGNKSKIIKYIGENKAIDSFEYDPFGRVILFEDSLKNITKTIYNENYVNDIGQGVLQEVIINPKGIKTVRIFDPFSNLSNKNVFDDNENIISSIDNFYDSNFNLVEQKNHIYEDINYKKSITSVYEYNENNLVKTLIRALKTKDERTTKYEYTNDGKVKLKILPSKINLHYTYNSLGYLKNLKSSDGKIDQYFEYDNLGRLLFAKDLIQKNEVTRKLDLFGNILEETIKTENNTFNPLFIEKTYDNFNRPIKIKLYNNGYVKYSYDPLFIRKIERSSNYDELKYSHSFEEFDLNENLIKENLIYNHGDTKYKRDSNEKVLEIKNTYFCQRCEYDETENLIKTTKSFENNDFEILDYSYDNFDELIVEKSKNFEHKYLYDSNFNRILKNENTVIFNNLDEIQQIEDINLTYDKNGNVIKKKSSNECVDYTFDPLNRLIKAKKENIDIEFTYDAIGRRLCKKVVDNTWFGDTYQENYLYDETQEIGAFDAKNKCKNLKILSYSSNNLFSRPIAIEINGSAYLPIIDVQGNIIKLISSWGFTKEENNFSSFGENLDKEKISLLNPWKYQGKRFDPELNLIYFGKRYYDPAIGRWISIDPVGFEDSLNLYQYVKNNPFKYIDVNGENLLGFCLGIGEMLLGGTLVVTGGIIEIGSFGTLTVAVGFQEAAGLSLLGHGFAQAMINSRDISFSSSKAIESPTVLWENSTEKTEKNNPFEGPVDEDVFIGDAEGNIIPVPEGHQISGSKDGKWIQVKDPNGVPVGIRKDGGHPKGPKHPDPRGWEPHGHRPGVSNPDGTPWLPIN